MSNVIGLSPGSPAERGEQWRLMRNWREAKKVLNPLDEWEGRILERDTNNYRKYLSSYVSKEAA